MKSNNSFFKFLYTISMLFSSYYNFSQNHYSARIIQPDPLSVPSIYIVSVTPDTKNIVVWDKSVNNFIDYFKIYRESTEQTNEWDSIGFNDYSKPSVFIDSSSKPS